MKEADAQHPYGYGKERNIFAMFQAMSVLFIGGGFSLYHGFASLLVSARFEYAPANWMRMNVSPRDDVSVRFVRVFSWLLESECNSVDQHFNGVSFRDFYLGELGTKFNRKQFIFPFLTVAVNRNFRSLD